jgi:hypothetical protein
MQVMGYPVEAFVIPRRAFRGYLDLEALMTVSWKWAI